MKKAYDVRLSLAKKIASILFAFVAIFMLFGGIKPIEAQAESTDAMEIERYDVKAVVQKDRTIRFHETIDVYFTYYLPSDATMFYRSLPIGQGERYFDVRAKCENNEDFSWNVKDNPDIRGFIDVNCVGGVERGVRRTYEIFYTLLPSKGSENGMILDVVGGGTSVPLHNVTVTVEFPAPCTNYTVYSGEYGYEGNDYASESLSDDQKTITLQAERLPVVYNERYDERMAAAITLDFELEKGAFISKSSAQIRGSFWVTLLVCLLVIGLAVLIGWKMKKTRDLVPVVSVKPPQGFDPLRMGKFIDGMVDSEDVTSMLYFFASAGYIKMDFSDQKDPLLIRTQKPMEEGMPPYQTAMLEGLFKRGMQVRISDLKERFYKTADKVKMLVSAKDIPRYEKKSLIGMGICCILAIALCIFLPAFIGLALVGGGYFHFGAGIFYAVPVAGVALLMKTWVDRKHKNGKGKNMGWLVSALAFSVLACLLITVFCNRHILSLVERIVVSVSAYAVVLGSVKILSYTERYNKALGDVLGFKDFILFAEKDRLEAMLEENPELYFDVLPYAQVLGVSDVWEEKFKGLKLDPPSWAYGTDFTLFDYLFLRNLMRTMSYQMLSRPQQSGGTFIGRSGGGGGFGGFSGGGSGGGGMGVR